mmetsp:Transcript_6052/g.9350  ORF Transcript_6052/g.9350 Transcript_6052/m.9350 type:complete len:102 (+) Transcript_6052:299-604(+)
MAQPGVTFFSSCFTFSSSSDSLLTACPWYIPVTYTKKGYRQLALKHHPDKSCNGLPGWVDSESLRSVGCWAVLTASTPVRWPKGHGQNDTSVDDIQCIPST